MDAYLQNALMLSQKAFDEADLDKLLNDFLEFEAQACGPTVEEMFDALSLSTNQVFGLTNGTGDAINASYCEDAINTSYCENAFVNVDATIDLHILMSLNIDYLRSLIVEHQSANDDAYRVSHYGAKISDLDESFCLGCDSNSDTYFALAA